MESLTLALIVYFVLIWMLFGGYFVYSVLFSTPFYPSKTKAIEKAFNDLEIKFDNTTNFVDIGSGDGRVVLWAGKKGMNAVGIELNPFFSLISRLKKLLFKVKKAKFLNDSFYKQNFAKYDIVYMFIYREHMDRLKTKLFSEMKTGSIIISNTFKFADIKPDRESGRFYLYEIK